MGVDAFVEKLGPPLATGIVLAILTGAATAIVAWRDHVASSTVRVGHLADDIAALRADFESFRNPGGRFTRHDGDRHWSRMDELDKRLREQESRPPRLNPALDDVRVTMTTCTEQMRQVIKEQDRLCERIRACK